MLCFPNIVYVIFVRTVSFRNFHLNHGHILAWFLKEQEAHFNENITLPVIKIMISCFFDKFRDIILIVFIFLFFFLQRKQTIDPANAIFCANFLLGNSLCPAAYRLINITRDWGASQFISNPQESFIGVGESRLWPTPPKWSPVDASFWSKRVYCLFNLKRLGVDY